MWVLEVVVESAGIDCGFVHGDWIEGVVVLLGVGGVGHALPLHDAEGGRLASRPIDELIFAELKAESGSSREED